MTYFNPKSIQGFNAASQGQFLYKSGDDIGFSNVTTKMKFVSFQSAWNMNDDVETFTYGAVNSDRNIPVTSPDTLEERELRHILYLKNTGSENRTITLSANAGTTILGNTSFTLYGNSFLQLTGVAFKTNDDTQSPSGITYIAIEPAYGYVPYNAVENSMGFITVNDIPQSNWLETNASSRAYIQNKPSVISGIVFNNAPVTVTDGIATMSYTQAQANWTQNNPSEIDYIKNKPTSLSEFTNDLAYPTIAVTTSPNNDNVTITVTNGNGTTNQYTIPLSGGGGTLTQLPANWNETDSSSVQYILNKPTLATVATSGSYNDLSNKPTIPAAQVNSDWTATSGIAEILHKPVFATVATTGQYDDLLGKPTLPAAPGILNTTNTSAQPISSNEALSSIVQLHKISKTGAYSDLIGVPNIPVNTSDLTNDSGFITSQVNANWDEANTSSPAYIQNKPLLHTVATTGDYNDLINKPNIPVVPSNVSAFQNDAGYITSSDIPPQIQSDWNENDTASPAYIQNKPSIPESSDDVDYLRFECRDNGERLLKLIREGNAPELSLEYKIIAENTSYNVDWTVWEYVTGTTLRSLIMPPKSIIYLRGDNYSLSGSFTTTNYYHFSHNAATLYCGGNLLTIYKKDGRVLSVGEQYRFYKLFATVSSSTCLLQSTPYINLYSASSTCFNNIFDGNTGLSLKDLRVDTIRTPDTYNANTHTLGTAVNMATGKLYVEKPAVSSYVTTLTYNDSTINWNSLTADYNAGKHIRCKETVNGETFYADLFSYEVVGTQMGNMPTFTFKYVESETDRNCIVYKCQYLQNNVAWLKTTESLDEIPLPSTYGQFLTYDSTNGLAWEDVLPEQSGHPGEYLMTNGAGVLSWSPASGGGVAQVNSDWNATSGVAQILNRPTLASVATTGNYNDLNNLPTIPASQVNSDWNATSGVAKILNKPDFAAVATSGSYNDLTNTPNIPTVPVNISAFNNDSGYITSAQIPPQINADWNASSGVAQILNKPTLAAVATSGSYNDLSNKPTIPDAPVNADWNAVSGLAQILNKPTIPTVPTNVSAFTNDAGYLTNATVPSEVLVCTFTRTGNNDYGEIDYTPSEIKAASDSGKIVICVENTKVYNLMRNSIGQKAYFARFENGIITELCSTDTGTDYRWDIVTYGVIEPEQSDWDETDATSLAYINNKPKIIKYDVAVVKTSDATQVVTFAENTRYTIVYRFDATVFNDTNYTLYLDFVSSEALEQTKAYPHTIIVKNDMTSTADIKTNIVVRVNGTTQTFTWLSNPYISYTHGAQGQVVNLRLWAAASLNIAVLTTEPNC